MKILVVYNTCGISGKENGQQYVDSIESILLQEIGSGDDFDVVMSSCMNRPESLERVYDAFGKAIHYNMIEEVHPVNVTFNHSVEEMVKRHGEYDGYLYMDSGSNFKAHPNLIKTLCKYLSTDKYAMITPQPSSDTEYYAGLGIGDYRGDDAKARQIMFKDGDFLIGPGKGMGTHVNLVNNKVRQAFGRVYPDIFASHCTESTFSFICASLKLQWVLLKDFIIEHKVSVDGQSSGFSPADWQYRGGQTWDHPYKIKSVYERICTPRGYEVGMGYEECRGIMMHDPECFDENYHAKNDQLRDYIKDTLYLKPEELDYKEIKHAFV